MRASARRARSRTSRARSERRSRWVWNELGALGVEVGLGVGLLALQRADAALQPRRSAASSALICGRQHALGALAAPDLALRDVDLVLEVVEAAARRRRALGEHGQDSPERKREDRSREQDAQAHAAAHGTSADRTRVNLRSQLCPVPTELAVGLAHARATGRSRPDSPRRVSWVPRSPARCRGFGGASLPSLNVLRIVGADSASVARSDAWLDPPPSAATPGSRSGCWSRCSCWALVYVVLIGVLFAAGAGGITILVVAGGLLSLQFFASDKLALRSMGAQEVSPQEAPRAARDDRAPLRAGRPAQAARSASSTLDDAQRLRARALAEDRDGLRDDGHHGAALARRARGRHGPRAHPHRQPRRDDHDARGLLRLDRVDDRPVRVLLRRRRRRTTTTAPSSSSSSSSRWSST